MGRSVRAAHETAIIATRGKPVRLSKSVRSRFKARMPEEFDSRGVGELVHSAKPPEFYGIVEKLYGGPYGELFARTRRPGWWQEGDQLPALQEATAT